MRLLAADEGVPGIPNPFTFFHHQIVPPPLGLVSGGASLGSIFSGNEDPWYRRSKAEAFGQSKEPGAVLPLLDLLRSFDPSDASGIYTARLALRNVLREPGAFSQLPPQDIDPKTARALAGIAVAVPTPYSAKWLLDLIRASAATIKERDLPSPGLKNSGTEPVPLLGMDQTLLAKVFTHIARHLPSEREGELAELVQSHFADDLDTQLDLFAAVREGKREQQPQSSSSSKTWVARDDDPLLPWASAIAKYLVAELSQSNATEWQPIDFSSARNSKSKAKSESPWFRTMRKCADGQERAFLDSHPPGGEKLTGILRSKTFDLPPLLSFWLAGHRGSPKKRAHEKNVVRLIDAETGDEIAHAYPPRSDTAKKITWQTARLATKRAYLELVDGDDGSAYAWLAAGGFEPSVVDIPEMGKPSRDHRVRAAAELATTTRITMTPEPGAGKHAGPAFPELVKYIYQLPDKETFSEDTRAALAAASMWALWLWPHEVMELARDPELAPA
ncbi:MAG TPA: hypothetical protein VGH65_03855, partial [Verrucomicrobiaceae bacterium]